MEKNEKKKEINIYEMNKTRPKTCELKRVGESWKEKGRKMKRI